MEEIEVVSVEPTGRLEGKKRLGFGYDVSFSDGTRLRVIISAPYVPKNELTPELKPGVERPDQWSDMGTREEGELLLGSSAGRVLARVKQIIDELPTVPAEDEDQP